MQFANTAAATRAKLPKNAPRKNYGVPEMDTAFKQVKDEADLGDSFSLRTLHHIG